MEHKRQVEDNPFDFAVSGRKDRRNHLSGLTGELSDGRRIFAGELKNLSVGGFQLTDLPTGFDSGYVNYTAIVSGGGKNFRLLVRPCWSKRHADQLHVDVGFKIMNAPWELVQYTAEKRDRRMVY
jgi:hypothetical protein